jgi:hypothetical protein
MLFFVIYGGETTRHERRAGRNKAGRKGPTNGKTDANREGAKPPGHVSQSCKEVQDLGYDFSRQWGEIAGIRYLVRQFLRLASPRRSLSASLQARNLYDHASKPDYDVRSGRG